MRRIGISIAPGNPDLLALIAAGATEAEFEQAGEVAHRMGKNGAYALGVLKRQRTEAAEAVKAMHKGPMPSVETPRERAARERAEEISPMAARKRPPPPTAEVIDVTSRRLA